MYRALILDMDGTIINTRKIVLDSLDVLAEEWDLNLTHEQRMRSLGCTSETFMAELGQMEHADELSHRWRQLMASMLDRIELFGGFGEVLGAPIRMGIVTNETNAELKENLRHLRLGGVFEYTVCADDLPHQKPHPLPLLHCIGAMGLEPREALFVGDTLYDMECAQAAGVDFGLALWGAGNADGFGKADYLFREPRQILAYIKHK